MPDVAEAAPAHDTVERPPIGLVIGAGGLLGSAMTHELRRLGSLAAFSPSYPWHDRSRFATVFADAAGAVADQAADLARPWAVYWCAGGGHVGATAQSLRDEELLVQEAVDVLAAARPRTTGIFCFASSAGAIYGGSQVHFADEETVPSPISDYGFAKLRQESLISHRLDGARHCRALHLRISNLYGPGQRAAKPQGLMSHLVRNTLQRVPTVIYVPLDTARDYLYSRSASRMAIFSAGEALRSDRPAGVRVLAAERSVSIGQIIGALSRVLRRRVPYVVTRTEQTPLQPLVLRFRSLDRRTHRLETVGLEEGMASIVKAAWRELAVSGWGC